MARPSKKRAVIYTRQSTYTEESISLELQETAAREHAERQGYEVVEVESDPGLTGRTFNRPGVASAMEALERGAADVIILWKWSRLSRSRLDWYLAADRAARAGGAIEAAAEPIDTSTSIGRLARGLMIELAAFESERAGDQWKEAQQRRLRNGRPHSGKPRFGYIYDPEEKLHKIDPVTGPILADVVRRYIAGESFDSLATWLHARGVRPVGGGAWAPVNLKRIVDSGFAAGWISAHGELHPGAHEPLITPAEWAAYQAARERRRGRPRAEASKYLLTGLIRCRTCGTAMCGDTATVRGKRYTYYLCYRNQTTRAHPRSRIPAHVAEDAVLDVVRTLAADAEALAGEAAPPPMPATDLEALHRAVSKEQRALSALTVRHIDGSVSDDAYKGAAEVLQERLDAARAALRAAEAAPAQAAVDVDTALHLIEDWDILPVHARREGLRAIIEQVAVDFEHGGAVAVAVAEGVRRS